MFRMAFVTAISIALGACTTAPFGETCGLVLPDGEGGLGSRGNSAREAARFDYYRCMASEGVEEAQYRLGIAYEEGLGTEINLKKARRWYEKAAAPKSGWEFSTSVSGRTKGQYLPYPTGEKSDGHEGAKRRLEQLRLNDQPSAEALKELRPYSISKTNGPKFGAWA